MGAVNELTLEELNDKFFEYVSSESNAEDAANFIYENLLEDVALGVLFDFHHGLKTGLTDLIEGDPEDEESLLIVNSSECDVFGFSRLKKTPDSNCACPNCERAVSATRFAPHLEKCMGMGRNSSRIASRRIASNSREPTSYAGLLSDDEDDADWSGGGGSTADKRKKKIRNHPQKKSAKLHNGGRTNGVSSDGLGAMDGPTLDSLSSGERKAIMQQICGVVSEHTKKLCTRSMRCPQHTDEQRRCARYDPAPATPPPAADEAPSPADSSPSPSSSCSSSSRRRDRHRARKHKDTNMAFLE